MGKARKMSLALVATTAAALCGGVYAASADSTGAFVNGDFESPVIGQAWQNLTGTDLPGWNITGDVDLVSWPSFAAHGDSGQALDLNGYHPGSISQSFNVISGATYELSYWINANPQNGGDASNPDPSARSYQVGLSDALSYTNAESYNLGDGWLHRSVSVTSSGTHATLTFAGTNLGWAGVLLDDVTVTQTSGASTVTYKGASQGVYTNKGTTVVQQAQVSSADLSCLAGRQVTFTVAGKTGTATTDANGLASAKFDVTGVAADNYLVQLEVAPSNGGLCQGDTDDQGHWIYKVSKK